MLLETIALVAAASTAPGTIALSDPQNVARYLQNNGYRAQLKQEGEDTWISSGASGWTFTVTFRNCEKGKNCKDLILTSAWDTNASNQPTLQKINEFNREKRFAKAYIDNDDDPVLEMDVLFTNGEMSEAMFAEHLDVWAQMVSVFAKHIGME